ncbi:MAG: glycosyltransferase family 2 protein, partial [Microthrixaceae bacterium]
MLPGTEARWEADAAAVIARHLTEGARGVYFHADGSGGVDGVEPRILPTLGPVGRLSPDPFAGAGFAPGSTGAAGDMRRIDEAGDMRRIDEVLAHLDSRPEPAPPVRPAGRPPEVAFVIPSPGNTEFLGRLFGGLADCDGVAEVVVVDNSAPTAEVDDFYGKWSDRLPLRVERIDPAGDFNYSHANNVGAGATASPVIAFCNDDIEVPADFINTGGLGRLTAWLSADGIGVVGPQLRYPDGSIQHGGVVIGLNGLAEHAFTGMRPNTETLIGCTDLPRDVSAVTGAFLVTSRELFDAVGGFDEELVLTGSDVWFCLRAAELGWGTAYDGSVHLIHHESAARGDTNHLEDFLGSVRRWSHIVEAGDPYWSARLAIHRHEPTLR